VIHIHRALLSVSDKRGLIEFARALHSFGVEILSTGGTHATLQEQGIPARQVSDVTGFPEILDGRVKTLHPLIHGALLSVDDNPSHQAQSKAHGIEPIELVVVNLYPFEQTIARTGVTLEEAIEQIDIGGPAMLRSAAKNYRFRAVIANPDRYPAIIAEMQEHHGCLSEETCFDLAGEVFRLTSTYDAAIARYLDTRNKRSASPDVLKIDAPKDLSLRYGENPHQTATLYGRFSKLFEHLHGKELSYNNIVDIAAATALAAEFEDPVVVIVKHTNPCGVGLGASLREAYEKAFATDNASAYGGIVAVNRPLDIEAATAINQIFTEVIIAPEFPGPTLDLLRKKKDRRLIRLTKGVAEALKEPTVRSVPGGFLLQDADADPAGEEDFNVVTRRAPTEEEVRGLRFAWRVAKHVKSNAIVYTTGDRTLGVGVGQMSRVDSSRIAVEKATHANLSLVGSVVASDAFFPFADGLLEAVKAGATAVIQPGGSVRDKEVIAAADEHNIAMVCTGRRHFRH
jgi:phosphoribosylaminoimidazolecarboxamide formyltransferase/IMP cyclohydrolase